MQIAHATTTTTTTIISVLTQQHPQATYHNCPSTPLARADVISLFSHVTLSETTTIFDHSLCQSNGSTTAGRPPLCQRPASHNQANKQKKTSKLHSNISCSDSSSNILTTNTKSHCVRTDGSTFIWICGCSYVSLSTTNRRLAHKAFST